MYYDNVVVDDDLLDIKWQLYKDIKNGNNVDIDDDNAICLTLRRLL